MTDYFTRYPKQIVLLEDEMVDLTIEDNKQRILLTETTLKYEELHRLFMNNGFKSTEGVEFPKERQIGSGLFKNLSDEWDMHIRFLALHEGLIAIDGEVEPSRKYLEHLQPSTGLWMSVIYEITDILQTVEAPIYLFYKKSLSYVKSILNDHNLQLKRPKNLTEWKPIIIGVTAATAIALLIWSLSKK